jgi:hypothetical protein
MGDQNILMPLVPPIRRFLFVFEAETEQPEPYIQVPDISPEIGRPYQKVRRISIEKVCCPPLCEVSDEGKVSLVSGQ